MNFRTPSVNLSATANLSNNWGIGAALVREEENSAGFRGYIDVLKEAMVGIATMNDRIPATIQRINFATAE
jgi:hypothetical protein